MLLLENLQVTIEALCVKIKRSLALNNRNNLLSGQYQKSPVSDLTAIILQFAERAKASDIHFEPQAECMRIRFRIDGVLMRVAVLPLEIANYVSSYLKLKAGLDIAEKRIPQDGSFFYAKQHLDVRIATMPVFFGEKIILRLLGSERKILSLPEMGFSAANLRLFKKLICSAGGIIAITGPVNSGKSTLLYAVLNYLNTEAVNIVTLEDPIELKLQGVNQTQINLKAGMDFATGLKAVLRQDPDIVMVGEIRDGIVAQEVVRAALTGHLVLTTLHTINAMGVPARLINMGVDSSMLSIALLASTAQRLVRGICPHCKETYIPAENSLEALVLGECFHRGLTLHRGRGCEFCYHSGYEGRVAIQEIMVVDDGIKALIAQRDVNLKLKRNLQLHQMKTLLDDGRAKILQGITTAQEVWSVLNGVYKFR